MKDKDLEEDDYSLDEDSVKAGTSLRQDNELFDEESYKPGTLISVKRHVFSSSKEEDWGIYSDKTCVMNLKGSRFSKKEKEFLRTVNGVNFIISGYKSGWKNISEFKRMIKKSMS